MDAYLTVIPRVFHSQNRQHHAGILNASYHQYIFLYTGMDGPERSELGNFFRNNANNVILIVSEDAGFSEQTLLFR